MEVPVARLLSWALVVGCGFVEALMGGESSEAVSSDARSTVTVPAELAPAVAAELETAPEEAATRLRERLVENLGVSVPIRDMRVLDALRRVPRHRFMPGESLELAYDDHAHPIGHGQTISQPTVVALMSEALALTGSERVLEIGTGSGYQAAVLSLLAGEVYSIELIEVLGAVSRTRLQKLGFANVQVRVADGYRGWPDAAPFDRVILTAAPREIPAELFAELREGGILVAPLGDELDQHLFRWTKRAARLEREDLGGVRFVPMVHDPAPSSARTEDPRPSP